MGILGLLKGLAPASITRVPGNRPSVRHKRKCPVCGYHGYFVQFGRPARIDARCRSCGSLERHRLFWLWFGDNMGELKGPILHFAPEKILEERLRKVCDNYSTADLFAPAELKLNIESLALPSGTVGTVICNHVLEHVKDRLALAEIHRVLVDGGRLLVSVPIIEGWDRTYEDDTIVEPALREIHFGQGDHVRLYGRDFRDRLRHAGFSAIEEVTAEGKNVVEYALQPGEKFFICTK